MTASYIRFSYADPDPHWQRRIKIDRARYEVRNALRKGVLTRGRCARQSERCAGQIEGHHEDYSRPLDVVWLCHRHHMDRHLELRPVA